MAGGRKSAASLAVAPPLDSASFAELPTYPDPPEDFSEADRERWTSIVRDWPLDHWRPSDLLLLRDMILTEQYVRDCDDRVKHEGMTIETPGGGLQLHPALTLRKWHLQTITTIQRALRICPSSRYERKDAKQNSRQAGNGSRPWEAGGKTKP